MDEFLFKGDRLCIPHISLRETLIKDLQETLIKDLHAGGLAGHLEKDNF